MPQTSWTATTAPYSLTAKRDPGNLTRRNHSPSTTLSKCVPDAVPHDSMMGPNIDDVDMKGIIPRIAERAFDAIMNSPANLEYLVKVSYMEIYMERIRPVASF